MWTPIHYVCTDTDPQTQTVTDIMMEIKPPRLHTGISSSSLACPCRPITGMMARAKALVTVTVSRGGAAAAKSS